MPIPKIPKKTRLTLDEMRAIVRRGEMVRYGGELIRTESELPSEAEMAAQSGDSAYAARTATEIDAQIAKLQSDKAKLTPAKSAEPDADEKRKPVEKK